MTTAPIPEHELKPGNWYYGALCECTRLNAVCEDLYNGKTEDQHLTLSPPISIRCECGKVTHADTLQKYRRTPN